MRTEVRPFLNALVQDIRFGARGLLREPVLTLVILVTLALGIGANSAMFSVVDGVLIRSLPYADPDELVRVSPEASFLRAEYVLAREQAHSFASLAAYQGGIGMSISGDGNAARLSGAWISPNLLSTLGVQPMGRNFLAEEEQPGQADVALISHRLWQQRYGADSDVIGRRIIIDGIAHTVAGVMPRGFAFPDAITDIWRPLIIDASQAGMYWGTGGIRVVGRLRDGVTHRAAQQELVALAEPMRLANPLWTPRQRYRADLTVIPLQEALVGASRQMLLILLGAVALVLLIACANVGNLLLARGLARERELAVRAALGASRARILRQLFTEVGLLAFVSAVAGIAAGWLVLRALTSLLPIDTPRLAEVRMDGRVLAFAAGISTVAALISGALPAFRLAGNRTSSVLREGRGVGSTRRALSSGLVIAEIALAMVLVVGAGLLLRTLRNLHDVDPGFSSGEMISARLSAAGLAYDQPQRRVQFFGEVVDRVSALPGLQSVAVTGQMPFDGRTLQTAAAVEFVTNDPNDLPMFDHRAVTPEYFTTLRIPLMAGRSFTASDRADSPPVVIVDETAARRFWPGESAIGKRVGRPWLREWRTVVGVVGNVRNNELTGESNPALYLPFAQEPARDAVVVVRGSTELEDLGNRLRSIVAKTDADVAVSEIRPVDEMVAGATSGERAAAVLIGAFGGLATLLGAVGLYGVLAYSVSQRRRELGVRLALGATRASILLLVLRTGLMLGGTGLLIGIPASLAASRGLKGMLYGIRSEDPLNLAAVALVLLATAALASLLPALRAVRVEPGETLRA